MVNYFDKLIGTTEDNGHKAGEQITLAETTLGKQRTALEAVKRKHDEEKVTVEKLMADKEEVKAIGEKGLQQLHAIFTSFVFPKKKDIIDHVKKLCENLVIPADVGERSQTK